MMDVSRLRARSRAHMPETCEVIRNTRVSDNEGGWVTEPSVVATYPCRYRTASATEVQLASSMQTAVDGVITVPHDADIREADTLRRGEVATEYTVTGILDQTQAFSAHVEVLCARA